MGRRGPQDGPDWRGVLKALDQPLAHLAASVQTGQYLSSRGFSRAAEAAYRDALASDPGNSQTIAGLVWLLELTGRSDEAHDLRRQAVEADLIRMGVPKEHLEEAAGFRLAAEGRAPVPLRVPQAYLASLFDNYADHFDAHLREVLDYRGPEMLAAVVRRLLPDAAELDVMDLGCGTGLAGVELRPLARRLEGIDLSPRMLDKARQRQVYDQLDQGDLCSLLAERPARYDLVVAADVLVYFGELEPVFFLVSGAIRRGGLFVASCENADEPGFRLCGTRRYAHHPDFVRRAAETCGWETVSAEPAVLRREHWNPVESTVFAFRAVGP
jgi:predicted TPR repeat methyltransferase